MNETIIDLIGNAGPLGAFLLYVLHQRKLDRASSSAQEDRFMKRLDEMDAKADESLKDLRSRYDVVLAGYNTERTALLDLAGNKLDQVITRLGMQPPAAAPAPPPAVPPPEPGPTTTLIDRKVQAAVEEALSKKGED